MCWFAITTFATTCFAPTTFAMAHFGHGEDSPWSSFAFIVFSVKIPPVGTKILHVSWRQVAAMGRFMFLTAKRGGRKLLHDGHLYTFQYNLVRNSAASSWRCVSSPPNGYQGGWPGRPSYHYRHVCSRRRPTPIPLSTSATTPEDVPSATCGSAWLQSLNCGSMYRQKFRKFLVSHRPLARACKIN